MPILRAEPEDFRVDELPSYPAAGEGDHTFVRVEKRLRDTEEVARALARMAGVAPRDVGYAGRKDRRAVTRQWFSVPALAPERATALELDGVKVLEAARHPHKLRTGHLRGNRFHLVLRESPPSLCAGAASVLAGFARRGVSNRFGPQRFGRAGDNVAQGRALLSGRTRIHNRRAARFLVSALQAAVFNEVLAQRTAALDCVEIGDVAQVRTSGGLFLVEDLEREAPRAANREISATGPIFGGRTLSPVGDVAERERAALSRVGVEPAWIERPPRGLRLRGARRAVRVLPEDVEAAAEGDALRLAFTLPPGSYATVLVEELVACFGDATLRDASREPALPSGVQGGVLP